MIAVEFVAATPETAALLASLQADFDEGNQAHGTHWAASRDSLQEPAEELAAAFFRKCGYCESMPEDVSYLNIDHFRPKSANPELMYSWENWVMSCQRCNTNKGTKWDALFLSPFGPDDPEASVGFLGQLVDPQDERGHRTAEWTVLDRPGLDVSRCQQLALVAAVGHIAQVTNDPTKLEACTNFAMASVGSDAPYCGAARWKFGPQPPGDWPPFLEALNVAFEVLADDLAGLL